MNEKVAKVLRRKIKEAFPKLNESSTPTLRQVYQKAKQKILNGELTIATIKQRTVQA